MTKEEFNTRNHEIILSCVPFEPQSISKVDLLAKLDADYDHKLSYRDRRQLHAWFATLVKRKLLTKDRWGHYAKPAPLSAMSAQIRQASKAIRATFEKL